MYIDTGITFYSKKFDYIYFIILYYFISDTYVCYCYWK